MHPKFVWFEFFEYFIAIPKFDYLYDIKYKPISEFAKNCCVEREYTL